MPTVLVVVLVVPATFPVAVKVGQSISGPIQSCVVRLEQLADGDLRSPTPVARSKDETAKLTMALDTTILRLNDVLQDASHHLGKLALDTTELKLASPAGGRDFSLSSSHPKSAPRCFWP